MVNVREEETCKHQIFKKPTKREKKRKMMKMKSTTTTRDIQIRRENDGSTTELV